MGPMTLRIRDETSFGQMLREMEVQLAEECIDIAGLIRARVHQEVRSHNATLQTPFVGLVEPVAREQALNGTSEIRRIDANEQTEAAKEAFVRGRVLILVDDRQVTELTDRVTLRSNSSVTFLKLVAIVGG